MKIQKISTLTPAASNKTPQKNLQDSANQNTSAKEISAKSNEAIKNNFMSGISFKGYTKQIERHYPYTGTSGVLIYSSDVNHPQYTTVREGRGGYDSQSTSEAKCSVYYADPGEQITDEIRNRHKFIVEYNSRPRDISTIEIERSEKASELIDMVDKLKVTVGILEAEDKVAGINLDDANKELEEKKKQYEAAKLNQEMKAGKKASIETELSDNRNKLNIAQTRYKTVKAREEAEYRAAERKRKLAEIQKQMTSVNDDATKQIQMIEDAKKQRLAELERQRKALLDEKN